MSEAEIKNTQKVQKFYQEAFAEYDRSLALANEMITEQKKEIARLNNIIDDMNEELRKTLNQTLVTISENQ